MLSIFEELETVSSHFCENGLNLVLSGYDEAATIPKSSIKVNNSHPIRLHMGMKGDLKLRLLEHGCVSSNQEYSPDVKFDSEERQHPDWKVTKENWVSLKTKRQDYEKVQKFIVKQKKKNCESQS